MKKSVQTVVGLAVLTAIVVVLQLFAGVVKFGVFQISLVLIPIVVGAALYGCLGGAWLGLVFGAVVLLNGDATLFYGFNMPGTIITVLVKGACAGLVAGLVYGALKKVNETLACFVAAIVAPIVNTGIFVLGCCIFFFNDLAGWGAEYGFTSAWKTIFIGMIGVNFFIELAVNTVFASTIARLIKLAKKEKIA